MLTTAQPVSSAEARPGAPQRRPAAAGSPVPVILALAWLAAVNCRLPLLAVGPLLPLIIPDLQLSATVAGLLTGLPLLLMGVIAIPGGLVADRLGPRRLLAGALLGVAASGALRGLASHEATLVAASVGLGLTVGAAQPALAQVARTVSRRRAGLATAVYANGLMLGALMGVALTSTVLVPLVGEASWRGAMLVWAAVGLASGLGWAAVRLPGHGTGAVATPMSLRQVMALPGLLPLAVVFAAQGLVFYALTTWLPQYYVTLGWSLAAAAWPLTVMSIASIIGGLLAPGAALLMGGPRWPLLLAGAVTTLGLAGFVLAPDGALVWSSAVGLGSSFAFTLGLAAPAELAPREKVGAAAGILLALGYLGSVLGPLGVGVLHDLTGGLDAGLACLVGVSVLLGLAAAAIPTSDGRNQAA